MMETPTIASMSYANAVTTAANLDAMGISGLHNNMLVGVDRRMQQYSDLQSFVPASDTKTEKEEAKMSTTTTRLVKVFIVDPNENLPLENRLLYRGDEKITDLTDQELFFEVDIKDVLTKHNAIRVATEDKKANKDKPVYLEPARVRDLKMQVIVLAQF
jgi:hypothetical protein